MKRFDDEPPQPAAEGPSYSPERLPPVPEEDSDIWQISPEIFGEVPDGEEGGDISEDAGDLGEAPSSAASRGTARRRPASSAAGPSPRAVRPRTGEPESEPSRDSRRSSSETPASWPNVASNLDNLPLSIRQHLERASQLAEQDPSTTASLAAGFLAHHTEDNEKRALRSINLETAPPETQEGLRKAMEKEGEMPSFRSRCCD